MLASACILLSFIVLWVLFALVRSYIYIYVYPATRYKYRGRKSTDQVKLIHKSRSSHDESKAPLARRITTKCRLIGSWSGRNSYIIFQWSADLVFWFVVLAFNFSRFFLFQGITVEIEFNMHCTSCLNEVRKCCKSKTGKNLSKSTLRKYRSIEISLLLMCMGCYKSL